MSITNRSENVRLRIIVNQLCLAMSARRAVRLACLEAAYGQLGIAINKMEDAQ